MKRPEIRNVIIAHGKPSRENYANPKNPKPHEASWLPWAADQAINNRIEASVPALPTPYDPEYVSCVAALLDGHEVSEHTVAVGHSMGCYLWLRWMSENRNQELGMLILVAPWLNPNEKYAGLPPFEIDPGLVERCVGGLAVFYSSEDDEQARASLATLRTAIPEGTPGATYTDIPHYGHYMLGNRMTFNEFPELIPVMLGE